MHPITRTLSAAIAAALTAGVLVVAGVTAASAAPADLDVVPREDCPLSAEQHAQRWEEREAWRGERGERGVARDRCRPPASETCPLSEQERAQRWQDRDQRRTPRDDAGSQPDRRGRGAGGPMSGPHGQSRTTT